MQLKQKISNFRSQMIMGRYSKALQIGEELNKSISMYNLSDNISLSKLCPNNHDILKLQNNILQQYKSCQQLQNMIKHNNKHKIQQDKISKWRINKWKKTYSNKSQISLILQQAVIQQQVKQTLQLKQKKYVNLNQQILDSLDCDLLLCLRIPHLFGFQCLKKLIQCSEQIAQSIIEYLASEGFIHLRLNEADEINYLVQKTTQCYQYNKIIMTAVDKTIHLEMQQYVLDSQILLVFIMIEQGVKFSII